MHMQHSFEVITVCPFPVRCVSFCMQKLDSLFWDGCTWILPVISEVSVGDEGNDLLQAQLIKSRSHFGDISVLLPSYAHRWIMSFLPFQLLEMVVVVVVGDLGVFTSVPLITLLLAGMNVTLFCSVHGIDPCTGPC